MPTERAVAVVRRSRRRDRTRPSSRYRAEGGLLCKMMTVLVEVGDEESKGPRLIFGPDQSDRHQKVHSL